MTKIFIIMALSIALATSLSLATNTEEKKEQYPTTFTSNSFNLVPSDHGSSSIRGASRVLAQYNPPRAPMTCDVFPRVCRNEGSPGPDCCRRQCVNVEVDGRNCVQCGRRCRYGEACCGGRCVSVIYDPKKCGSCSNNCMNSGFCRYGMCNYA